MSPRFDLRNILITSLVILFFAGAPSASADEGCFVERGRFSETNITAVAASGHLVVMLQRGAWDTRPKLRVAEISQFGLTEVGQWQATWYVSDIALNAATAVIAADRGLVSLDLSDPRHPLKLDAVDLVDAQHLAVSAGRAFVATSGAGGNGWFDIVDITNPGAMDGNGQLFWGRPDPPKTGIDAAGDLVVIADDFGVLVIDVSEPWSPVEIGRWFRSGVQDVALIADLAVVAVTDPSGPVPFGISMVDLANPDLPALLGAWTAPSAVHSVAEYGGAALVGTESDGLFLIDIADPTGPVVIDRWIAPGMSANHLATAWPTIVFSDVVRGAVVLGLAPSCLPPRRPSGRVGS